MSTVNQIFNCDAINFLHSYNTSTNQTLTVDACMRDLGFLKWSTQKIKEMVKKDTTEPEPELKGDNE